MSVLRTFREYLLLCKERNLIATPGGETVKYLPRSLLNTLKQPPLLSGPRSEAHAVIEGETIERAKLNDADLVKKYHDKIGKGSMFERRSVESQLQALGATTLKRSQLENHKEFDEIAAESQIYGKKRRALKESPETHFNLHQESVREILEALIAITPKSHTPDTPPPIKLKDVTRAKRKVSSHVYEEIPLLPFFKDDPWIFEDYVYALTHSTVHHKQSSKFNGIIPNILKNLFHPLNAATIPLRTTDSYNDLLHYYSNKWNISTCRELFVQMKLENVRANTTTFNIMLKTLIKSKHLRHTHDPYDITLRTLKEMERSGVQADLATWNTIYNFFDDEVSKRLLLENRKLLLLPMDQFLIKAVINDVANQETTTSSGLMELIEAFDIPIDQNLINSMLKVYVREEQYSAAWVLVEFSSKEKFLRADVRQLNLFLITISNSGRIDMLMAALNTFKKRFKVKPNFDSYNLVMKCISRSRDWPGKLTVLRVLYHQMMEDLNNCIAGEYWLRRIRSRLKFLFDADVKLKPDLTESELQFKKEITEIRWKYDATPRNYREKIPLDFPEVAQQLGYNAPDLDGIDDIEERKARMRSYRRRIRAISIMKGLVKRIPYANNSYEALQNEMKERKII